MFFLSIPRRDPSILCIPTTIITRCQSHWLPKKRLSRTAMNDLRQLNSMVSCLSQYTEPCFNSHTLKDPQTYNIEALSTKFHISHDAVRRILKSKFIPDQDIARRQEDKRYKAMGERQRAFRKRNNNNNATSSESRGGSSQQ